MCPRSRLRRSVFFDRPVCALGVGPAQMNIKMEPRTHGLETMRSSANLSVQTDLEEPRNNTIRAQPLLEGDALGIAETHKGLFGIGVDLVVDLLGLDGVAHLAR